MSISRRGFLGVLGAVPLAFTVKIKAIPPTTPPTPLTSRVPPLGGLKVTIRADVKTLQDGIISAQAQVDEFNFKDGRWAIEFERFTKPTTIVGGEIVVLNDKGILLLTTPIAMHTGARHLNPGDSLLTTLDLRDWGIT